MKYDTLVLSGGGIKGFYLLGALFCAFSRGYINTGIQSYIGTSVGAIICYLLCIGYTPIEIIVRLNSSRLLDKTFDFSVLSLANGKGAMSFGVIHTFLEELTIDKIGKVLTLGRLKEEYGKSLYTTTYNITRNCTEYIGPDNHPDMPCLTAIRLSSNVPFVFEPYKYLDCYYIDGGVTDNFPAKKAQEIGKNIFGAYIYLDRQAIKYRPEDTLMSYSVKLLQIPIFSLQEEYKNPSGGNSVSNSFLVPIETKEFFSFTSMNVSLRDRLDMVSFGYSEMNKALDGELSGTQEFVEKVTVKKVKEKLD